MVNWNNRERSLGLYCVLSGPLCGDLWHGYSVCGLSHMSHIKLYVAYLWHWLQLVIMVWCLLVTVRWTLWLPAPLLALWSSTHTSQEVINLRTSHFKVRPVYWNSYLKMSISLVLNNIYIVLIILYWPTHQIRICAC